MNEQVIKGSIALIKHTDDGETKLETPEAGAEFSVYLKSSGSYDMERLQLYFRGHTDAVAYLKKIKAI